MNALLNKKYFPWYAFAVGNVFLTTGIIIAGSLAMAIIAEGIILLLTGIVTLIVQNT